MGSRLARYRTIALLGRGGMGSVHRAFDTLLRRDVAIKVLHAGKDSAAADARRRLLREARIGAALGHENVVTIYDLGEDDDGDAFIVMELVDGETLRAIMVSARTIDRATKLKWLLQIASALEAAHEAGLVHLDIKPENVIVTAEGKIKVLDFGIGRLREHDPGSSPAPSAPESLRGVGTPAYMAPEQWRGEELDARADQYAWGILAYELLSGRRPVIVVDGKPTPRGTLTSLVERGFPPELDVIIARATAATPEERFPSMKTLLAAWPQTTEQPLEAAPTTPRPDAIREAAPVDAGVPMMTTGSTVVVPVASPVRREEHLATIQSAGDSGAPPPAREEPPRRRSFALAAAVLITAVVVLGLLVRARSRANDPAKAATAQVHLVAMAGAHTIVRVGRTASCVLMPDRTVSCWGDGRATPAKIEGLTDAFEVSIGTTHGCALSTTNRDRISGDVYCWDTTSLVAQKVSFPVARRFSSVAAASTHSCAQTDRDSAELYCWGDNAYGQLGDGTTESSAVPKKVAFADGAHVARFSLGDDLSCAIVKPSNELRCWGRNDAGQAGQDPASAPFVKAPSAVPGLPVANGVFPGGRHVCARDATSRELWCWGANDRGQLGIGRASAWERPTHVPGVTAIDTMRTGVSHSCAMLAGAGLHMRGRCWGSNEYGQLGIPAGVDQVAAVDSLAVDANPFDAKISDHGCRVDYTSGAVWCWGRNDKQQLGDGTGRSSHVPVQVRSP